MIHYRAVFSEQQLLELQELYNSQQLLSVQLSEKLENSEVRMPTIQNAMIIYCLFYYHKMTEFLPTIQKKLQETECTLLDLEERHRQANATIKEKDFLISNLLKSGRCLASFQLCHVALASLSFLSPSADSIVLIKYLQLQTQQSQNRLPQPKIK